MAGEAAVSFDQARRLVVATAAAGVPIELVCPLIVQEPILQACQNIHTDSIFKFINVV